MSNTVRPATEHDVPVISELEANIFGSTAWSRDLVIEEVTGPHRTYIVLEDAHGKILGYGGVLVIGHDADIQTIAIVPESRGNGLGRTLLTELLSEARVKDAWQVFLEVRADNEAAVSLYRSYGFEHLAVRKQYYQPDGVDALVMRLRLAPTSASEKGTS